MTAAPKIKSVITITEKAAEQVKLLLSQAKRPSIGLRIGVKPGGCSDYSYFVEYAYSTEPFDEVVNAFGVTVLIDPKALMHLIGSQMDYAEDNFKSGFTFNNPNAKNICGCSKSFST